MTILGMEEGFFWENVGYILVFSLLLVYVFFGSKFLRDARSLEEGSSQREYFIGLGLFIISVAIGESIYLIDLVFRTYMEERLFLPLGADAGQNSWQAIVGYDLTSLIDRDYYIVAFTFILISLSFLLKPLETFMLKRGRPVLTYVNRILIPFPVLIRLFEVTSHDWFGIKVLAGSIPFILFTLLWFIVMGAIGASIAVLVGLYVKMGIKAPKGSTLKKKSLLIIFGILLWMIGVFTTATVFRELGRGAWYFLPVIPVILVLSLYCLINGFKRGL